MKHIKKIIIIVLSLATLVSTHATGFTNNNTTTNQRSKDIVITDNGIYIKGTYYSIEEFTQLLKLAHKSTRQKRSLTAVSSLVAGTWWIPGIGKIVVTAAGVIIVGGVVVAVGSWLFNAINVHFSRKESIEKARREIPKRLLKDNGDLKMDAFNNRISRRSKKAILKNNKTGWYLEKDDAEHTGKAYKLKNEKGDRVATVDKNGKIIGD